jgi:hypothetical protein
MQVALLSYFDIGVSYGLSDSVFRSAAREDPRLGIVGLTPAIGHGVVADIRETHPAILSAWRTEAIQQADRSVMELDPTDPRDQFYVELKELLRTHPITYCRLTIFAIGTVFVDLRFGSGVPSHLLRGLTKCFEFAGYRPLIAKQLHRAAVERVGETLEEPTTMASPLTALTARRLPDISRTEEDGHDYEERILLPSFTSVLLATDPGDERLVEDLLKRLDPLETHTTIDFEYHGRLHCGWATDAVVARALVRPDNMGSDLPEDQVLRMLACIQIGHVFLGVCEAFEQLFMGEVDEQVDGYLRAHEAGRSADALNRLRNLALAMVSLTDFDLVTEADEDRRFFDEFRKVSRIDGKRQFIERAADMVYNVSEVETQHSSERRQNALNGILLLLTTITLLSVSADAYNFVSGSGSLIAHRPERFRTLIEVILSLGLIGALGVYFVTVSHPMRVRRRKRSRGTSAEPWADLTNPTRPVGRPQ